MLKSRLAKYIAVALSAVLIANSALPAYAEEIGENIAVSYEDGEISDALSGQERSGAEDVEETGQEGQEQYGETAPEEREVFEADGTMTDDEAGDYPADEDAGTEDDALLGTEESQEDGSAREDEFLTENPVASVTAGSSTHEYTDFDEAAEAWKNAGAGAKLTLLENVETSQIISPEGGTEKRPKILDLNDHGILYKGDERVIEVLYGSYMRLVDGSKEHTERYITLENGRGIAVDESAPDNGADHVAVSGGYITGGADSGITNGGVFEMNGGTICGNITTNTGGAGVLNVDTFTMNGGIISYNTDSCSAGGGVYNYGGTFFMNDGEISNNSTNGNGGGVCNDGIFTMEGGSICDNSADYDGGGVCNNNEFSMNDGEISNNSTNGNGGGVYNNGIFTMEGGSICDNSTDYDGGGVYNYGGPFFMNDGEISSNSTNGNGGGVYNNSEIFMTGGEISSNSTNGNGGGVYNNSGIFMTGGEISGNTADAGNAIYKAADSEVEFAGAISVSEATDGTGAQTVTARTAARNVNSYGYIKVVYFAASVTYDGTTTKYTVFSKAVAAWNEAGAGAVLTLVDDVKITETICVEGGTEEEPMILDLNDHGIIVRDVCGNAIYVGGQGYFELTDSCSLPREHYVVAEDGRGIGADPEAPEDGSDYWTVTGGFITGSTGSAITNYGTFVMRKGTIIGNRLYYSDGAGVINYGTFIMKGGEIRNNRAGRYGGGVYNSGKLKLNGGEIRENEADEGSAIYNRNNYGTITDIDADIIAGVSASGEDSLSVSGYNFTQQINTYGYIKALPHHLDHDIACIISKDGDTTSYNGFYDAVEAWIVAGDGATLKLLDDVILVGTISISGGTDDHPMILDLNDHGILNATNAKPVIYVEDNTSFELTDNSVVQTKRYIITEEGKGKKVAVTAPDDGSVSVEVSGGYISGGIKGIEVGEHGNFVMNGGTICGCSNTDYPGGGVYNYGTFRMNGGKILSNTAQHGGGVFNDRTFVMSGGEISGNTSICDGGGICNSGYIMINGGKITNNISEERGGGIYNSSRILISAGEISGNTAEEGKAVQNDCEIIFSGTVHAGNETDGKDESTVSSAVATENINTYGYIRVEYDSPDAPIASVTSRNGETISCGTFEEAVYFWRAAGNGAVLKLLDDVVLTETVYIDSGCEDYPMVLDLNDHGIVSEFDDEYVIKVNDGRFFKLVDESGTKTEKYVLLSEGRGIGVETSTPDDSDDYVKVKGGFITGGKNCYGVCNEGSFTMSGGTICGIIEAGVGNYGIFTMTDGTICRNIGGVYNVNLFTMAGGTICDNVSSDNGGGVCNTGTFRMIGGDIKNNTASSHGGGVYNEGDFSMSGGGISGNTGGAVYNNGGTVGFSGNVYAGAAANGHDVGKVTADEASAGINGFGYIRVEPENGTQNVARVISNDGDATDYKNFQMALSYWNASGAGSTLKLLGDVRTEDTIVIDRGTKDYPMILDLNDHGITFSGEKGNVIMIDYCGCLELKDTGTKHTKRYITLSEGRGTGVTAQIPSGGTDYVQVTGGYITGGYTTEVFGAGVCSYGSFIMNRGTIAGNTVVISSGLDGGGVYNEGMFVMNGGMITANSAIYGGGLSGIGRFFINGGKISGNYAYYGAGAGFAGPFIMKGGEISGNHAEQTGGGIQNDGDFSMTGGRIADNLSDGNGGGVYNVYGTFTMRGGEISGNLADEETGCCGGGIYNEYGTLTMSGGVIRDNKATDGKAVYNCADVEKVRFSGYVYARTDRTKKAHLVKASQAPGIINTFGYIKVSPESSDSDNLAIVSVKTGKTKEYKFFDEAVSAWKSAGDGATLKLLDDVEAAETIEIDTGTEDYPMILDLNDHGIMFAGDEGSVISSDSFLTVKDTGRTRTKRYITVSDGRAIFADTQAPETGTDSVEITGGYIAGGNANNGGGILNGGTLVMSGGTVCGNAAGNFGGGIFSTGTFNLSGGKICANAASKGGGVHVLGGTFSMTGGELSGNSAEIAGSAICNTAGTVTFGADVYAGSAADGRDAHLIDKETAADEAESLGFIRLMDTSDPLYLTHGIIGPQTYTGSPIMPEIVVHFGTHLLKEKQDYTISFSNNTNAGEASFTITGKGNFSGKISDSFTILKKDITEAGVTVSEIPSSKCNGKEQKPVPTVAYGKKKLASGKDFTVTYYDDETCENDPVTPKDGGTYYAKITGIGNFTGSVVLPFVIAGDNEIPVSKLSVAKITDQQYTGEELEPAVSVKDGKNLLVKGRDFEVEYVNNTEIGTASAVITGIGGTYVGSRTVNFSITGTSVKKLSLEGFRSSFEYTDGNPKTQDIRLIHKMSGGNRTLRIISKDEYDQIEDPDERLNWDCTVEYGDNVEIGTATITLTGVNGYFDQIVKTFKITGTSISSAKIEKFRDTFGYDGSAKTQSEMVLKYKNAALTKDTEYSVEYIDNTSIGTATMIIIGKGRFYGSVKKTFKITGGSPIGNAQITGFIPSYEYTGSEITQTGMVLSNGGTALTEDNDYTVSYQKNTNAGTATMIVTGKGWWYGTVQKTFKITPFDIVRNNGGAMSISLASDKFCYSKSGVKPEPKVLFNGRPLTPGTDYTVSYSNTDAVRSADNDKAPSVKISGKGNFTNSTTLKFSIEKKNIADLIFTAEPVVYKNSKGNWKTKVTLAGEDGKKLTVNKDYTAIFTSDEDGLHRIDNDKDYIAPEGSDIYVHMDAAGNSPYTGHLKASYHIYKYDINKLSATLEPKTYTGSPVTLEEEDFVWKSGSSIADDVTFRIDESTYKDNVNKGGASVVVYGTGECTGSKKITFTIGPRDVLWWWRNLFN